MLDFGLFKMDTTSFVVIAAIFAFAGQLLLCFKVSSLLVRLLPVIFSLLCAVGFGVMLIMSDGWDAVGYLVLVMFSGGITLVCGIGWGIWAIVKVVRSKRA